MSVVHRGIPGHFIGCRNCCFHMHSTVDGRWKVSTVGCYHPRGADSNRPEPIGAGEDSLYETMVFDLRDKSDAHWSGVSCVRYATEAAAEQGHADTIAEYLVEPTNPPTRAPRRTYRTATGTIDLAVGDVIEGTEGHGTSWENTAQLKVLYLIDSDSSVFARDLSTSKEGPWFTFCRDWKHVTEGAH